MGKVANPQPWSTRALLQGPSFSPSCRTCSKILSLKIWVCERLQCGCHKKSGEVTSGSLSQLANPPYKILTKDKSSMSPSPPPLLTCCCLEHQEEESTEERQDPHGWEVPARSQLWGEEKGGRDEQECPCLLRDGTEERGQPVQDET